MTRWLALTLVAVGLAVTSIAFANTITPQIGGGFSLDGGISAGGNAPSPPPVNPCTGVIDASVGCPLPMLGI